MSNEKEVMYTIPLNSLQKILDYLTARPYGEVFQLVKMIQDAKMAEPSKRVVKSEG